ncbi:tetratricopeptide repeat protein, partial [Patescibacteria group bacterium]|nr:tetratricopeptide repeat protein [Patescibacteria group bacterium]
NLGLAYYRQQKFALACEAYAAALERDQANPERLAALGRALFANNRFMEAAENLEKATARLSRNTELLRILAESYMQMGDTPSAEETYKKINKLEPYDEEVKEKLSALAGANV